MGSDIEVSQSKIKSWRNCRQAYHYKYFEKLKRSRVKRPFKFGGIVHKMLEADANGDDPFKELDKISFKDRKLFNAEKEMYGEIVQDIGTIMEEYFDYWPKDHLRPLRKNKKSAEHFFRIEIEPGLYFKGIIDQVTKAPNGLKWLTEHKTFTKLPDEDARWRNLQSVAYFRAIEMMGWWDNIAGTCWNYIRSKPPTRPKKLKSGGLSQAKIDTLPSVLIETIKSYGLKPRDFKPMIKKAEDNRDKYFLRIFTPVNKKVVDTVFSGFIDTAREIAQYHGKKQDMNIDRHCQFCDYEPLCRAKLTGSDIDFIKQREYYIDDKKTEDELEERSNLNE